MNRANVLFMLLGVWCVASVLVALGWAAWRAGTKADAEEVEIDMAAWKARKNAEWIREAREYRRDLNAREAQRKA